MEKDCNSPTKTNLDTEEDQRGDDSYSYNSFNITINPRLLRVPTLLNLLPLSLLLPRVTSSRIWEAVVY